MKNVENIIAHFIARQGTSEEISAQDLLAQHPDQHEALIKRLQALSAIDETLAQFNPKKSRLPQTLGRYHLKKTLGMGGMGTVMLAYDPHLKRHVAVKVLRNLSFGNTQSIQRFYRESLSIAALSHPNIVPIYEVDEDQGFHFIVMQYLEGIGLDAFITWASQHPSKLDEYVQKQDLPHIDKNLGAQSPLHASSYIEMICKLGIEAGKAVAFAHSKGILHRDLKPANMMLTRDGRLVIFDFGLSHDLSQKRLTVSGQILGTPFYAPPEQLLSQSKEDLTPKIDIYALGVSLYEMLTFDLPHPDQSLAKLIASYRLEKSASLRKHLPDAHSDLITLIDKSIELNPAHRYPTMADFVSDLESFARHAPISARPPTLLRRSQRFIQRWIKSPRVWAATGIILLAIAGINFQNYQAKGKQLAALQLYHQGMLLQADQDKAGAYELFLSASQSDPHNIQIWKALYDSTENMDQKAAFINTALHHNPAHPELLTLKLEVMTQQEGSERAAQFIDDLLTEFPHNEAFAFAKGLNMVKTENLVAAKAYTEAWLKKNPESERLNYLMGLLCEKEKNSACASTYYAKALDTPPYSSAKAITILNYFREHHKKFAALVLTTKALKQDYSNTLLHYLAFKIAMDIFDSERAQHHAEAMVQLSPDSHRSWIAKADLASAGGKHQAAIEYLLHTYTHNQNPDATLIQKMIFQYGYLKDGAAILALSQAHPDLLDMYHPLAMAFGYYLKNDTSNAWDHLSKADLKSYTPMMAAYAVHLHALIRSKQDNRPLQSTLQEMMHQYQNNAYIKAYLARRYWYSLESSEKNDTTALAFIKEYGLSASLRKRELLFPPNWTFEVDNGRPTYFFVSPQSSPLDAFHSSCQITLRMDARNAEQAKTFESYVNSLKTDAAPVKYLFLESGLTLLTDRYQNPYGYQNTMFSSETQVKITALCSATDFPLESALMKAFIRNYVESGPTATTSQ